MSEKKVTAIAHFPGGNTARYRGSGGRPLERWKKQMKASGAGRITTQVEKA